MALISVDPERHSQQLGKYISSFGGDLIGLTGSPPEIVKATGAFGVAASRVELAGGSYTMDHSATVFVLDSEARIVAVFTPPLRTGRSRATSSNSRPSLSAQRLMNEAPGAGGRAFVALQHLLPQHGISRLVLAATRSRAPAFKNALIRLFVRGFRPDMYDAVEARAKGVREFQRILHARAARRHAARRSGSARRSSRRSTAP